MFKKVPILLTVCILSLALLGFVALVASKDSRGQNHKQADVLEESNQEDEKQEKQAILTKIDSTNQVMGFKDISTGEAYQLNFTAGTSLKDKHGIERVIDQFEPGSIVMISYLEAEEKLLSLQESSDTWEYTKVKNLTYNQSEKSVSIGDTKYQYDNSLCLISDGRSITFTDLNENDVLTVRGKDKRVYSICVTMGHGYIKLENDSLLLGGWIDVDQDISKPIVEDMLLAVPEGEHNITVNNNGVGGTKRVTIKRDETTVLDLGDYRQETKKSGSIQFKITPKEAKLYINQKLTDYSKLVTLDYGSYRIDVTANGKDTYSKTLVVGSTYAEITIDLDKSSASGNDTSSDKNKAESSESSVPSNTIKKIEVPNLTGDPTLGTSSESDTESSLDLNALLNALTGSGEE